MAMFERKSTEEGVRSLLDDVIAAVTPLGYGPVAVNRVRLILEELLTNIRLHAYTDAAGWILIEILPQKPRQCAHISLRITDWGPKFNPLHAYVPPKPALDVETSQIGGLGLHLVHKMNAVLEYERTQSMDGKPAGNRLTVTIPTQESVAEPDNCMPGRKN